ncbi:MAG TPA: DUF4282 domain-containing protein [Anaerolineaceae bacterium]|nr:DUF4282 domain-containing protein [Anaerolineaceae bacterium]
MDDFLHFRKLITPSLIKVLFWMSSLICIIAGIVLIASSFGTYGSGAVSFLFGICIALLGPLFSRIICETLFVIFQNYQGAPASGLTGKTAKRGAQTKK